MPTILLKGGHVIAPGDGAHGLDADLDVLLEDGRIRRIAPKLPEAADEVIDVRGHIVAPGFVDIHVHLREPGGEESETLETGLQAAVAGGFTAVCPMPNTRPVNDNPEATRRMIDRAAELGLARVFPIAAVSASSDGERLTDFEALVAAGAVAFSDDGRPVKTAGLLRGALEECRRLGVPLIEHCEDASLSAGGALHEGPVARDLGVRGIPSTSEEVCLARDLVLAGSLGAHLHVAHISSAGAVELVRATRRKGVRVTAEVTPHHFVLTDEAVRRYGTAAKMNPPLRSAHDVEAVLAGIADGTLDVIATDHAPHVAHLKAKPLADAPFGVIGLETALALGLTFLVHSGRVTMMEFIRLITANPAHIINKPVGHLTEGDAADVTVFAPDLEWTYRTDRGKSKSRNSPFDGWKLKGAVTATIVGGRVVYRREA